MVLRAGFWVLIASLHDLCIHFTFSKVRVQHAKIRKYHRFRFIYSKEFMLFEPHLNYYESLFVFFAET